jgi:hypothetical protein
MRSVFRSILLAAGVSVALASNVFANAPVRELLPAPDPFVLPGGTGYCDFDVLFAISTNREYGITWSYPDGSTRFRFQGYVAVEVSNLETGKVLEFNAGGPGTMWFDADGFITSWIAEGHNFYFGGLEPLQSSGMYEYVGRIDNVNGTWLGQRYDVCAALAQQ